MYFLTSEAKEKKIAEYNKIIDRRKRDIALNRMLYEIFSKELDEVYEAEVLDLKRLEKTMKGSEISQNSKEN